MNNPHIPQMERRLRPKQVWQIIGVSRPKLYSMIQKGQFPKPLKDGKVAFWASSEVEQWVRDSIANAKREAVAKG